MLLLIRNGLLGTLAGACIGLGALTVDGQTTAMTHAAIAADLSQALDVQSHFTAEVALDPIVLVDHFTQRGFLILGQILDADVGINVGELQNFLCASSADAVDVSQTDLDSLFTCLLYTSFNMEITLSHGRGYVSSDKNKSATMPIGTIAVDSIYTPVYKVNYTVENTRVGNMTDYDKLTLEVWTDQTISARDAVSLGAKILSDHLSLFTACLLYTSSATCCRLRKNSKEDK